MAWLIVLGTILVIDAILWWWKGGDWTLTTNLWEAMRLPIVSGLFGVLVGHVVSPFPSALFHQTGNQIVIGGFLLLSIVGSYYPTRTITRLDRFAIFLIGFVLGILFWPQ